MITRLLRAPAPPGVAVVLQCKAHAGLAQRPGGPALEILPDHINQKDHLAVLARADAVILPYDARSYSSRTSGLLVEAIHCGTMPFVSAPTWLSNELEQLGLPELIVDWSRADVWSYIDRCVRNESLRHRFTEARRRYQRYHSVETYAAVLKLTVREVESAPYAS